MQKSKEWTNEKLIGLVNDCQDLNSNWKWQTFKFVDVFDFQDLPRNSIVIQTLFFPLRVLRPLQQFNRFYKL